MVEMVGTGGATYVLFMVHANTGNDDDNDDDDDNDNNNNNNDNDNDTLIFYIYGDGNIYNWRRNFFN